MEVVLNILHHHIRKICIKNIIIAFIPLIIFTIPLLLLPFRDIFYPVDLSRPSEFESVYDNDQLYVDITIDTLHFTGYQLISGNRITGSYYYCIYEDKVFFVLLNNTSKKPKDTIYNVNCRGKLSQWDSNLRTAMAGYSGDIQFSDAGLVSLTSPIMLDETSYNFTLYTYMFVYMICFIVILVLFILVNLVQFAIPDLHSSFNKFRHLSPHTHLHGVVQEMQNVRAIVNNIYFTEHYLISFERNGLVILPLNSIKWVYEQSKTHHILWFKIKTTYNIHFQSVRRIRSVISGKPKEDLDTIIDYLSNNYPDITIGYSLENKKKFHKYI